MNVGVLVRRHLLLISQLEIRLANVMELQASPDSAVILLGYKERGRLEALLLEL